MRRTAGLFALLLASCLGPQLVTSTQDGPARKLTVWYSGKAGWGYVTEDVMRERTDEAEAFAKQQCDGGIEVTGRRAEGRDNWLDVSCTAAAPAAKSAP